MPSEYPNDGKCPAPVRLEDGVNMTMIRKAAVAMISTSILALGSLSIAGLSAASGTSLASASPAASATHMEY